MEKSKQRKDISLCGLFDDDCVCKEMTQEKPLCKDCPLVKKEEREGVK